MGKQQPPGPGWWWNWVDVVEESFCYIWVVLALSVMLITVMYMNRESRLVQRSLVVMTNDPYHHHPVAKSNCNMFSGKWVFDNETFPLYRDWNCSFMFDDLACGKYHRHDLNYQYWRWQPDDCHLPKFDAKALLRVLRNKRLVFVGDSVNRNQWVSFVCMIESSIPPNSKSWTLNGSLYSFSAKEYNASIDFYWSPVLVESNSDDPSSHHLRERVVRIGSIEKHGKHWANADVLVFNSFLWWRVPKLKVLKGSFGNPKAAVKEVEYKKCYEMALKTWSKFVLRNLDMNRTRLFWVSMSPTHSRPENWLSPAAAAGGGGKCMKETEPAGKEELRGSETDPKLMRITENAIVNLKQRGVKIDLLNITQLSAYRKDGHPSIYRKQWRPLTKEQLANPVSYADCTHWCLPGVPDVWNQILYAYLSIN